MSLSHTTTECQQRLRKKKTSAAYTISGMTSKCKQTGPNTFFKTGVMKSASVCYTCTDKPFLKRITLKALILIFTSNKRL